MLATDLAIALDPVRLAERVGIRPDLWQAEALRSTSGRMLLNCSRQSGKSTVAALLALHTALYAHGSLSLMLSPTLRQSGELFRAAKAIYSALPDAIPTEEETALTMRLVNGSRIVSLPGKEGTVRGYSRVRLLVIDEAARVADALYAAVRPMLATSRGRLLALSTPFGTRGWWYEAWRSSEPWEKYEIPATTCPRIPTEFLEEEQRNLGQWWFDQEYLCKFLDAETQPFRREDVDRAFVEEVTPWAL